MMLTVNGLRLSAVSERHKSYSTLWSLPRDGQDVATQDIESPFLPSHEAAGLVLVLHPCLSIPIVVVHTSGPVHGPVALIVRYLIVCLLWDLSHCRLVARQEVSQPLVSICEIARSYKKFLKRLSNRYYTLTVWHHLRFLSDRVRWVDLLLWIRVCRLLWLLVIDRISGVLLIDRVTWIDLIVGVIRALLVPRIAWVGLVVGYVWSLLAARIVRDLRIVWVLLIVGKIRVLLVGRIVWILRVSIVAGVLAVIGISCLVVRRLGNRIA